MYNLKDPSTCTPLISAEDAKKQSDKRRSELDLIAREKIIKIIKNAIEEGKKQVPIYDGIPASVKEELREKGYKIRYFHEEFAWGDMITWS